jgi:site-specific recombinase XerD
MSIETIKYCSKTDVERLMSKITSIRDRSMFGTMYFYGLRCQEIIDLSLQDLRIEDRRLFIHAAKGGESGEVILKPELIKLFKNYLTERGNLPGALFLSRNHRGVSRSLVFKLFQGYATAAKLPEDKRHPHVLRHSIAIHLVEQGEDVRSIKDHLRQKNIENTMIYVRIADKRRLEMQERALSGTGIASIRGG